MRVPILIAILALSTLVMAMEYYTSASLHLASTAIVNDIAHLRGADNSLECQKVETRSHDILSNVNEGQRRNIRWTAAIPLLSLLLLVSELVRRRPSRK